MITALGITLALELLLHEPHFWRLRKEIATLLVLLLPAATTSLLFADFGLVTLGVAYITIARLFNLFRLVKDRSKEQYLRRSALQASRYFVAVQSLVLAAAYVGYNPALTGTIMLAVACLQVAVALPVVIFTVRNIRKTRHIRNQTYYSDKELPTVTVAIPARNETQDLEQCLHSLIASDYPKLEIVVLDDCSRDRTPDIIKGFAHDGVRFVKGAEPDDNWLPKNAAYNRLLEEASGELVLFCGVDTRFQPTTVRALVTTLLNKQKKMISVMPQRLSHTNSATLIQPMRYWWEFALPRRLFNRPPVLSTCWIIERATLKKLGGFASWKRAIIPEALIARELTKHDAYSFIRADEELAVETRKTWRDQRDTAIRVRYPQIHRRPELAFGLLLLELLVLVAPVPLLIWALVQGTALTALLAAISFVLLVFTHLLIVSVSNPAGVPLALINFPLVVMYEISLGLLSMARYEFSTVDWKGRNVCIPVMRVIHKLPDVEKQL